MSSASKLKLGRMVSPLERETKGARVLWPNALPDANFYVLAHEDNPSASNEGLLLICGWVNRVHLWVEPEGEGSTHLATRTSAQPKNIRYVIYACDLLI